MCPSTVSTRRLGSESFVTPRVATASGHYARTARFSGVHEPALALAVGFASCGGRTDLPIGPDPSKCARSLREAECVRTGGVYGAGGLSREVFCNCQADDVGKPCDNLECEGLCLGVGGATSCDGVTEGECSERRVMFGCFCVYGFGASSEPSYVCID